MKTKEIIGMVFAVILGIPIMALFGVFLFGGVCSQIERCDKWAGYIGAETVTYQCWVDTSEPVRPGRHLVGSEVHWGWCDGKIVSGKIVSGKLRIK